MIDFSKLLLLYSRQESSTEVFEAWKNDIYHKTGSFSNTTLQDFKKTDIYKLDYYRWAMGFLEKEFVRLHRESAEEQEVNRIKDKPISYEKKIESIKKNQEKKEIQNDHFDISRQGNSSSENSYYGKLENKIKTLTQSNEELQEKLIQIIEKQDEIEEENKSLHDKINEIENSYNFSLTIEELWKKIDQLKNNINDVHSITDKLSSSITKNQTSIVDLTNNLKNNNDKQFNKILKLKNEMTDQIRKLSLKINSLEQATSSLHVSINDIKEALKKEFEITLLPEMPAKLFKKSPYNP